MGVFNSCNTFAAPTIGMPECSHLVAPACDADFAIRGVREFRERLADGRLRIARKRRPFFVFTSKTRSLSATKRERTLPGDARRRG